MRVLEKTMTTLIIAMTDGSENVTIEDCVEMNIRNRDLVEQNWALGPEKASIDPDANIDYWQQMASVWNITEAEARRRLCANCEYYDNTPKAQKLMEAIPFDEYDLDGGGRGCCVKFDFICHNLRTCQAWEEKPFHKMHDDDKPEGMDD